MASRPYVGSEGSSGGGGGGGVAGEAAVGNWRAGKQSLVLVGPGRRAVTFAGSKVCEQPQSEVRSEGYNVEQDGKCISALNYWWRFGGNGIDMEGVNEDAGSQARSDSGQGGIKRRSSILKGAKKNFSNSPTATAVITSEIKVSRRVSFANSDEIKEFVVNSDWPMETEKDKEAGKHLEEDEFPPLFQICHTEYVCADETSFNRTASNVEGTTDLILLDAASSLASILGGGMKTSVSAATTESVSHNPICAPDATMWETNMSIDTTAFQASHKMGPPAWLSEGSTKLYPSGADLMDLTRVLDTTREGKTKREAKLQLGCNKMNPITARMEEAERESNTRDEKSQRKMVDDVVDMEVTGILAGCRSRIHKSQEKMADEDAGDTEESSIFGARAGRVKKSQNKKKLITSKMKKTGTFEEWMASTRSHQQKQQKKIFDDLADFLAKTINTTASMEETGILGLGDGGKDQSKTSEEMADMEETDILDQSNTSEEMASIEETGVPGTFHDKNNARESKTSAAAAEDSETLEMREGNTEKGQGETIGEMVNILLETSKTTIDMEETDVFRGWTARKEKHQRKTIDETNVILAKTINTTADMEETDVLGLGNDGKHQSSTREEMEETTVSVKWHSRDRKSKTSAAASEDTETLGMWEGGTGKDQVETSGKTVDILGKTSNATADMEETDAFRQWTARKAKSQGKMTDETSVVLVKTINTTVDMEETDVLGLGGEDQTSEEMAGKEETGVSGKWQGRDDARQSKTSGAVAEDTEVLGMWGDSTEKVQNKTIGETIAIFEKMSKSTADMEETNIFGGWTARKEKSQRKTTDETSVVLAKTINTTADMEETDVLGLVDGGKDQSSKSEEMAEMEETGVSRKWQGRDKKSKTNGATAEDVEFLEMRESSTGKDQGETTGKTIDILPKTSIVRGMMEETIILEKRKGGEYQGKVNCYAIDREKVGIFGDWKVVNPPITSQNKTSNVMNNSQVKAVDEPMDVAVETGVLGSCEGSNKKICLVKDVTVVLQVDMDVSCETEETAGGRLKTFEEDGSGKDETHQMVCSRLTSLREDAHHALQQALDGREGRCMVKQTRLLPMLSDEGQCKDDACVSVLDMEQAVNRQEGEKQADSAASHALPKTARSADKAESAPCFVPKTGRRFENDVVATPAEDKVGCIADISATSGIDSSDMSYWKDEVLVRSMEDFPDEGECLLEEKLFEEGRKQHRKSTPPGMPLFESTRIVGLQQLAFPTEVDQENPSVTIQTESPSVHGECGQSQKSTYSEIMESISKALEEDSSQDWLYLLQLSTVHQEEQISSPGSQTSPTTEATQDPSSSPDPSSPSSSEDDISFKEESLPLQSMKPATGAHLFPPQHSSGKLLWELQDWGEGMAVYFFPVCRLQLQVTLGLARSTGHCAVLGLAMRPQESLPENWILPHRILLRQCDPLLLAARCPSTCQLPDLLQGLQVHVLQASALAEDLRYVSCSFLNFQLQDYSVSLDMVNSNLMVFFRVTIHYGSDWNFSSQDVTVHNHHGDFGINRAFHLFFSDGSTFCLTDEYSPSTNRYATLGGHEVGTSVSRFNRDGGEFVEGKFPGLAAFQKGNKAFEKEEMVRAVAEEVGRGLHQLRNFVVRLQHRIVQLAQKFLSTTTASPSLNLFTLP